MTIIQMAPMEGTVYHPLQSQSHRDTCWEEGYIELPERLRERAYACKGYCELVIEDGVLVDILPMTPPAEANPSAEEDRDSMLVDVSYRITLLELGVE